MAHQATAHLSNAELNHYLSNMVIILSSPRSGSTLLFEQISKQQDVWSIGNESHIIFSQFPHLKFADNQFTSGALKAEHADSRTSRLIKACFVFLLQNNQKQRFIDPNNVSKPNPPLIIEKTPRNALNIAFLLKIFPSAKFIYLYRDPRQTIASLVEAWTVGLQTGRFATYINLPDWHLPAWCFLLPPGWQTVKNKSLFEICCFQWAKSNQAILNHIKTDNGLKYNAIEFDNLITATQSALENIMSFLLPDANELCFDFSLNHSKSTLSQPKADKWMKHKNEIMALENQWQPVWDDIKSLKN